MGWVGGGGKQGVTVEKVKGAMLCWLCYPPVLHNHPVLNHTSCCAALCVDCRGGHGRTGTLVAVMLGRLYGLNSSAALRLTQVC